MLQAILTKNFIRYNTITVIFIAAYLAAGFIKPEIISWIWTGFSPDGHIEDLRRVFYISVKYTLFSYGFILLSIVLYKVTKSDTDVYNNLKRYNYIIFIFGVVVGLFLFLSFGYELGFIHTDRSDSPLYQEDGFFETMTMLCMILAGILLLISFFTTKKEAKTSEKLKRYLKFTVLLFGIGLIWIGLEEISYGQRIFGWETPEALLVVNQQQEINLHNFIDPTKYILHDIFSVFLVFVMAGSFYLNYTDSKKYYWRIILPHPTLFPMIFLMIYSRFPYISYYHEFMEEFLGIVSILYVLRYYMITRQSLFDDKLLAEGKPV